MLLLLHKLTTWHLLRTMTLNCLCLSVLFWWMRRAAVSSSAVVPLHLVCFASWRSWRTLATALTPLWTLLYSRSPPTPASAPVLMRNGTRPLQSLIVLSSPRGPIRPSVTHTHANVKLTRMYTHVFMLLAGAHTCTHGWLSRHPSLYFIFFSCFAATHSPSFFLSFTLRWQ